MIGFDDLGSKGWLGNQMFQYASLRGIAANRGYDFCIPPDDGTRLTNYELHNTFKLKSAKNLGYIGGLYKHPTSDDICHSTTFNFNQQFFDECPDNVNISGFFQSEKWFKNIENEIREDFQFLDEILEPCRDMISQFDIPPIFLHIRRGDYVERSDYHNNLPLQYFKDALEKFDKEIPVLIFSDDIDWCKKQDLFEDDRFHFSETEDRITINSYMINQGCKSYLEGLLVPYYDLCLMTLCDGAIISNSSFSWWGAWLQNNSRDIISPDKDKWAGKLNTANYSDIIPDGWKVL